MNTRHSLRGRLLPARRLAVAACVVLLARGSLQAAQTAAAPAGLSFTAAGKEFHFDTGALPGRSAPAADRSAFTPWWKLAPARLWRAQPGVLTASSRSTACSRPMPVSALRPGTGPARPIALFGGRRGQVVGRQGPSLRHDGPLSLLRARHARLHGCGYPPARAAAVRVVPGQLFRRLSCQLRPRARRRHGWRVRQAGFHRSRSVRRRVADVSARPGGGGG